MSKRLQVLVTDEEMRLVKEMAAASHVSSGQWVRQLIRQATERRSPKTYEERMRLTLEAAKFNLPTCDIDQMNREIEEGYVSGLR